MLQGILHLVRERHAPKTEAMSVVRRCFPELGMLQSRGLSVGSIAQSMLEQF